jgi:precorrin-2 dehydrogenase/sirohydrochlorin ferrochelatase
VRNFVLVDLILSNSTVLIVGGGSVGERKAKSLANECRRVIVASKGFTRGLSALGREEGERVELVKVDFENDINVDRGILDGLLSRADLVIIATNNIRLNGEIAEKAKQKGVLAGAVDNPSASDFYFPAVKSVGNVRVAVSTGGRSPAMAKAICRRLSQEITREDLLLVELHDRVRRLAKERLPTPRSRKSAVYKVLRNDKIKKLLREGHFKEAEVVAEGIVLHSI